AATPHEISPGVSTPQHVGPNGSSGSRSLPRSDDAMKATQKEPAAAIEREPASRPASPAAAGAETREQDPRGKSVQQEAHAAPAELAKPKKGLWGSSFSMSLPSIAGGVSSLLGLGKRNPGQAQQFQEGER